jgi:hypothetical protein
MRTVGAVLIVGLLVVLGSVTRAAADDTTRNRADITLMFRKLEIGRAHV